MNGSKVSVEERVSVVVDTNIFVGAGFRPDSASGGIIEAVRDGRLRMIWTDATRGETRRVLEKIPPLDWSVFEPLFVEAGRVEGAPDEGGLDWVHDESDRKFAALARAANAVLVTNDDHLLADRDQAGFPVLRSGEFVERGM